MAAAETRKDTASTAMALAAPASLMSKPPIDGPKKTLTPSVTWNLLLASTSWSGSTIPGSNA